MLVIANGRMKKSGKENMNNNEEMKRKKKKTSRHNNKNRMILEIRTKTPITTPNIDDNDDNDLTGDNDNEDNYNGYNDDDKTDRQQCCFYSITSCVSIAIAYYEYQG